MKRLFLIPALGLVTLTLSSPVQAQSSGRWISAAREAYAGADQQPYYDSRRAAYDNGYREGARRGEQDARRRSAAYYENDRTWQRANSGYNRSFGDLERYRQQFRVGYASGYRDSYDRYAPGAGAYGSGRAVPRQAPYGYGNQDRYPGPYANQGPYGGGRYGYGAGYSNGVNDGIEKGREDARKRRSFDVLRHEWYRDGDRHYRSEYGPRRQYENIYREGFKEGYARGYRELAYVR